MKVLLTADLTSKTVLNGSSAWAPPVYTYGEDLTIALRFQQTVDGNVITPTLNISSLAASLGYIDARPAQGQWKLQVGSGLQTTSNTTAFLGADSTAANLAAAINALSAVVATYGTAVAHFANGSYFLLFGNGGTEVPLTVRDNRLFPVSLGRTTAAQADGRWIHEIRLIQMPVADTSDSAAILPPQPVVTTIQSGGSSGSSTWNTVQELYVSPDFIAQYTLSLGGVKTAPLSVDDNTTTIQAALVAVLGNNFNVTLSAPWTASIEFTGIYAGSPVADLLVTPLNPPPGDLTFTLTLDSNALLSWLRAVSTINVPLEVWIVVMGEDGQWKNQVVFQQLITVQRPVKWPEFATVPAINWLVPPSPKDYVPFSLSTFVTGHQFYRAVVGNAALTSFVIAHGLATDDTVVFVRQNSSPGNQLVCGTDYSVVFTDSNTCTVTALTGAPALNAWAVTVFSEQVVEAFAAGLTVTEGQVTGLLDDLDTVNTRLTNLETLLPASASLSGTTTGANAITIPILPKSEILFAFDSTNTPITDPTKLPDKYGSYLLPALNRVGNDGALPTTPLPAPSAGKLYTNAAIQQIPIGGKIWSGWSPAGGFVASDGRANYPVTRSGTKDSYYPTAFQRPLFEIYVNEMQFAPGATGTLPFGLALQLINATSEGQWVVVVEQGAITEESDASSSSSSSSSSSFGSDPDGTYDRNLFDVVWNTATPLLKFPLIITPTLQAHFFGVTLANNAGAITANAQYYNRIVAANAAAPTSANFALRGRMINFDTRNPVEKHAHGWLSYALQAPPTGSLGLTITT